MPEDLVPGVPAASPQPDVAAPSAEPVAQPEGIPEPGTPSPTQVPPAEEARVPLSRLNEVIEQRKAAEARETRLLEALQQVRQPAMPQMPVADPWEGYTNHPDPSTAQFYQNQKRLVESALTQREQAVRQEVSQEMGSLRAQVAHLNTERFREKNPDIKPGSEEEGQIVAYMQGQMDGVRHPIESARRNVMYDRLEAENRALKTKQGSVIAKVAANASEPTAGMPPTAGLPQPPKDWRDNVRQVFRKGGDLAALVNAAGASRAPTQEG